MANCILIKNGGQEIKGSATPNDVLEDVTFMSSNSDKVQTGTIIAMSSLVPTRGNIWLEPSWGICYPIMKGYYNGAGSVYSSLNNFGNASVDDVLKGKTFTSAAGFKKSGTFGKTWFVNLYTSGQTRIYSDIIDTESTITKNWYAYGFGVKWNSNRWMYICLDASNDKSSWTEIKQLSQGAGISNTGGRNGMFSLTGASSYRYYRIRSEVQSDNSDSSGTIATLILKEQ